jgi:Transcription factor WhiB
LTDRRLVVVSLFTADLALDLGTATATIAAGSHPAHWVNRAACRGLDAPSMFADRWGVGAQARRLRTAALATCRTCVVRRECGLAALADIDAGMSLYGVHCGIEFTDVTPSRQERDVARLRTVVASLDPATSADSPEARMSSLRRSGRGPLLAQLHQPPPASAVALRMLARAIATTAVDESMPGAEDDELTDRALAASARR